MIVLQDYIVKTEDHSTTPSQEMSEMLQQITFVDEAS